jgi:hypothetical protein
MNQTILTKTKKTTDHNPKTSLSAVTTTPEMNYGLSSILILQRMIGNQAIRKFLTSAVIQRIPEADVVTNLNARIAANDKPGFFQVLRSENGAHTASTTIRNAIANLLTAGSITQAEAWRAVCLQVLGDETNWPPVMNNFVTGVEQGVFTPPAAMPSGTAEALRRTAVLQAHLAASGPGTSLYYDYQGLFNSLWDDPAYSGLGDDFDPLLGSKGPRTQRSWAIFQQIYNTNVPIKQGYDNNTSNLRTLIDQYVGPDSRNLIASPRLQVLRGLFLAQGLISSNNISNPQYLAFKATITTAAQNLKSDDREEINNSHEWRLIIDRTVSGQRLRQNLSDFLRTAWQTAPSITSPSSTAPTGSVPAPPPVAAALTADQQTFVAGLNLQGPAGPINSNNEEEQLDFTPRSTRDPAGLAVQSRVTVAPAGLVRSGEQTQQPWPPTAATGGIHSAVVGVDGGTTGFTNFTALLTLVSPQGSIPLATSPQTTVRINDQRQAWFIANIEPGLIYSDQNMAYLWVSGATVEYYGGQQLLQITPRLNGNVANRGLTVYIQAKLQKNGTNFYTSQLLEFGTTSIERQLGGVTVLESVPPPASPDNMNLTVDCYTTNNTATPPFHSMAVNFQINPGAAFTNAQLLTQAQQDYNDLNSANPGGVLDQMLNTMGPQERRTAEAIQAGFIKLEPCLIRPDSAKYLRNHGGNPRQQVAYLVGHTVVNAAHTLVGEPGASAWQWGSFPNMVFVNYTESLANPATKRPLSDFVPTIIHETVHALDRRPHASYNIERYKTEFRAYWMEGAFNSESTAFDPSLDNMGPKSPRARKIFENLYGSSTYPWVKPLYDANTNHFREKVDAYIVPDGINLINSVRLEHLRAMIEGFSGTFNTHRTAVQTYYNSTCDADDKQEISGNPSWRALVERKYNSSQQPLIKADLSIP